MPRWGFGLDLAGYSTGKSRLCAIKIDHREASATILDGCPFSVRRNGGNRLEPIIRSELQTLRLITKKWPIAVDVPIDLSELPNLENAEHVWQLTKRPIDFALNALPAFSDKLGACVARFQNLMTKGHLQDLLGDRLFETYPAGLLKLLDHPHEKYKGNNDRCAGVRREICKRLHIEPNDNLSDDDLDSILCATVAVANKSDRLEGADLVKKVSERFPKRSISNRRAPKGYALLNQWPVDTFVVSRCDYCKWIKQQKL